MFIRYCNTPGWARFAFSVRLEFMRLVSRIGAGRMDRGQCPCTLNGWAAPDRGTASFPICIAVADIGLVQWFSTWGSGPPRGSNDDLPGVTKSWAVPETRTTLPAFLQLPSRAVSGACGHPAGLFLEPTAAHSAFSQPPIQFTAWVGGQRLEVN